MIHTEALPWLKEEKRSENDFTMKKKSDTRQS